MKGFNSPSADRQSAPAAAARVQQHVLAERPIDEQQLMPSDLASAGEAEGHKSTILSTWPEQQRHFGRMQLEDRPEKSSGALSQACPVSDNAKQSEQLAQQQQSSAQAHQALSAQPGNTGRQGRPLPGSRARAPLMVR